MVDRMESSQLHTINYTENELVKDHLRHLGFTYPVRSHFLENILEMTRYRLTPSNQIDNYGQDKMWKMQKQTIRKRKTQIASAVEVWSLHAVIMNQIELIMRRVIRVRAGAFGDEISYLAIEIGGVGLCI